LAPGLTAGSGSAGLPPTIATVLSGPAVRQALLIEMSLPVQTGTKSRLSAEPGAASPSLKDKQGERLNPGRQDVVQ
jgi:hypothetical protein